MFAHILKVSILAATLTGCGTDDVSSLRSIMGQMDLKLITKSENNQSKHYSSVGSLMASYQNPEDAEQNFTFPYCTAVAVGNGYFLTAGHCERESAVVDPNQIATSTDSSHIEVHTFDEQLRLYYNGELIGEAADASERQKVTFLYQSETYDFAVFRDESSSLSAPYVDLVQPRMATAGSPAQLIGHPHGLPKTLAHTCSIQHVDEKGYMYHDCDSVSGASGGLMISGGAASGLHIQATAPNSGSYYRDNERFESREELSRYFQCERDCPEYLGFNVAISFTMIRQDIQSNAAELWKKIKETKPCDSSY